MGGCVFESVGSWPDIVSARTVDPAEELSSLIFAKDYPAAYSTLRRLKEPLSGKQACECLFFGLSCTPKLFGEVLEHCEPGEYVWADVLPQPGRDDRCVEVVGTILTLAAAKNRTRHMELLLEKGWDVNSASPASEQALLDTPGVCMNYSMLNGGVMGRKWNECAGKLVDWIIEHATPLAAAILCGSEKAVKALLRREGVRGLESAAVARAAVAALQGTPEQRKCLRLALGLASGADDPEGMAREVLGERAPDVAAIVDLSTVDEFALRLEGAPCPVERLCAAAETLLEEEEDGGRLVEPVGREEKLSAMLERFPELGREKRVRDAMLNAILVRIVGKRDYQALLDRWKAVCGGVRDLTGAGRDRIDQIGMLDEDGARNILDELGEGGALRAAAESYWFAGREEDCGGHTLFEVCLDRVEAYRVSGEGISPLAAHLLDMGGRRLLCKAAARGALRGESREEMLAYLCEEGGHPTLRVLVLTIPDEQIGVASARPQPEDAEACRKWKEMDAEGQAGFVRRMWEEPLCAEECRKRLSLENWRNGAGDWFLGLYGGEEIDGVILYSLPAAACCGRNPELLRVLLEDGSDPRAYWDEKWEDSKELLSGTMLCLAAASGRTEQVRLLLDWGLDPNEDDMARSELYPDGIGGTRRIVTPLYMALRKGHPETAALLREHGGYAYPPYPPYERQFAVEHRADGSRRLRRLGTDDGAGDTAD